MFHNTRTRLPLVATGLALAFACLPIQGEEKDPADPTRNTSVSAKQATLSGKVVDLHQYFTGERINPADRTSPTDRTKPADTAIKPDDKDKEHAHKMKNQFMGLETSTGLVFLCIQKDEPGVYATPRDDEPRTPAAKDTDARAADKPYPAQWLDKQAQVTGSLYEKNGIKFLVVTKIVSSTDSTTPGTTPRPNTPAPK